MCFMLRVIFLIIGICVIILAFSFVFISVPLKWDELNN